MCLYLITKRKLYLHTPWISSSVQLFQHGQSNVFTVGKNFSQRFCSKDSSQSSGGKKLCALGIITDVDNCRHWGADLVVNHGINGNCNAVFGQDLLRGDIKRNGSQISDNNLKRWKTLIIIHLIKIHSNSYLVHAWNNEKETRANSSTFLDASKSEDDSSFVFLEIILLLSMYKINRNLQYIKSTYLNHTNANAQ